MRLYHCAAFLGAYVLAACAGGFVHALLTTHTMAALVAGTLLQPFAPALRAYAHVSGGDQIACACARRDAAHVRLFEEPTYRPYMRRLAGECW